MKQIYTILIILFFYSLTLSAQTNTNFKSTVFIGHANRTQTLDSLIENASSLALDVNDYKKEFYNAITDNNNADSLLILVANKFFTHLAYGNHAPLLEYQNAKFKTNAYDVSGLVKWYANNKTLLELVKYFTYCSKEVSVILDSLKFYQAIPNINKATILSKAANDFRWFNAIKQKNRVIIVNIPSTQLKAYDSNKLVLNMRVIVGNKKTKTNTLSAQVNSILLNPYWTVPKSIIKNEMFEKFASDKDFFIKNDYELLDTKNKIVAVSTIDFDKYAPDNFPFTVRQNTGLDNSLGLLKIDFESPASIYLHDTPNKKLFANTNRFYSHGCVRMEKPIEIGKWLLANNKIAIDTFDFKKPEKYSRPIPIPVTIPTQIIIWYSLIDFDKNGTLKFYKNVYNLN